MHLKKQGTVLISATVILSLMSILGCFMFKMIKNNNELSNLYEFEKDRFDLSRNEEQILNQFMVELNKDKLSNIDNNDYEKDIFSENFKKEIGNNSLQYYQGDNKILLITSRENNIIRERLIIYILKDEKITLIPTYKFNDYTK